MAYILLTYILLVTFLPGAAASHFCCEETEASTEQSSNHHENENCPPLCHCTCCGHSYIINDLVSEESENNPEILSRPEFIPSFIIKAFPEGIWRPPQFC